MKRCPQCRRDYYDDSLLYCLDDGSTLLEGPGTPDGDSAATKILTGAEPVGVRAASRTASWKKVLPLMFAAAIVVALLFGYWAWSARGQPAINTIAVLPFENEDHDPDSEYLSDGIPESLINGLAQLPQLKVAARTLAFRYRNSDPRTIGRDLQVKVILTGHLRRIADKLSIQVEMVDTDNGTTLWGNNYERSASDALAIKQAIARDVTDQLRLKLSINQQTLINTHDTANAEAYQLYLQGRYFWNKFTEEGFEKSIDYFKKAVEKDPTYARGYTGLADAYSLLGEFGSGPTEPLFSQARANAERALQLDPAVGEAHLSMGIVNLFYDWDASSAEKHLRRALELNPEDPQSHHFYGHYLQLTGQLDAARAEMRRGADLDPTNLVVNTEAGWAEYILHDYDAAARQYKKVLELDPNFVLASLWLAQAYQQQGRYKEARAELERAERVEPGWSWITAQVGCIDAREGKRSEAATAISKLESQGKRAWVDPTAIALIAVADHDNDRAMRFLEQSFKEKGPQVPWFYVEPQLDPIRTDPRFQDLLSRIGLRR